MVLLQPEGSQVPTNVLSLRAELAADAGLDGDALGWGEGVPGTKVTLLRVRDFEPILRTEALTDAVGSVRFEGLPGGIQWVTIFRRLEGTEAEALGPEWPVAALAGGGKVSVAAGVDTVLPLRPPRAGGLVISEVSLQSPPVFEYVGEYYGALYLEVYNNGPTTAYLDGMLLGYAYWWFWDFSRNNHHACLDSEPMRVDPDGLWVGRILRFPGNGTEHPVSPGQAVVIAVSATDHRYVHPTMPDLTNADFEVRPADLSYADNPAVPDMEDVGPEGFQRYMFIGVSTLWFLAAPTDLAALQTVKDPAASGIAYSFVRIPRDRILDVTLIWWDNAGQYTQTGGSPICQDPVNPLFDAVPGGFGTGMQSALSAQRRAVRARDGRVMVLDTDVSAVDFLMLPKTPGWVPEVEW